MGGRKNPVWRVVVADQRSPRDGRVIETVGRYNPQTEPSQIVIDRERVRHWLSRGAQPSDTVRKLLRAHGMSATGGELPGGARAGEGAPAGALASNGAAAYAEAGTETGTADLGVAGGPDTVVDAREAVTTEAAPPGEGAPEPEPAPDGSPLPEAVAPSEAAGPLEPAPPPEAGDPPAGATPPAS